MERVKHGRTPGKGAVFKERGTRVKVFHGNGGFVYTLHCNAVKATVHALH